MSNIQKAIVQASTLLSKLSNTSHFVEVEDVKKFLGSAMVEVSELRLDL